MSPHCLACSQEASMIALNVAHVLPIVAFATFLIGTVGARPLDDSARARHDHGTTTVKVSGTGFDDLKNAIVHWKKPTAAGFIQQSTEIVELYGDLRGRVLYHVTSVFDFVNGTLVNTGEQVYSGTIAGSAPVMIHDDQFRFEVNLVTGAETGRVFLVNHIAGPKVRCVLEGVGTGLNAEGNPTFTYSGECTFRGQ
jgi:hypothetical protein